MQLIMYLIWCTGNEFESWNPLDWKPNPKVLEKIVDPKLHSWASKLNEFWNELGRKIKAEVKEEPERFSMIYVSNGIIVPGGRFREFYYWDSYWIQIGLLHSEMNTTVRGMIDNFLEMVENDKYGFVPNGGRVYYRRSQPRFLFLWSKTTSNTSTSMVGRSISAAFSQYLKRNSCFGWIIEWCLWSMKITMLTY